MCFLKILYLFLWQMMVNKRNKQIKYIEIALNVEQQTFEGILQEKF